MTTVRTPIDIADLDFGTNIDDTEGGFTFFVDVSSPGDVDFYALKAGGCKAVIFQTGDGLGAAFANDVPARLAPQARAAGLRIGFYHYNRPRRLAQGNIADEARWMKQLVDRAGGLRPGVDLRIVMDVEAPDAQDIAVDIAEFTRQLRDQLRPLFGHEPLLYSGWQYAKDHLGSVSNDLWVAWYPSGGLSFQTAQTRWHENIRDSAELGGLRPVAWQYGGDVAGGVPGVSACDCNIAPADIFTALLIPSSVQDLPDRTRPTVQPLSPQRSGVQAWTITAANGRTILAMQADGNLVVSREGVAVWASGTAGRGREAMIQGDGNLVVYGESTALWASGTASHPGATLAVQDDGNVVIYDGTQALWATGTNVAALGANVAAPVTSVAEHGAANVDLKWALARIVEWNFRDGVRSFQEAFTAWDINVDGTMGTKTAEAVKHLVDAGGKLSEHFHLDEFRCTHCRRARVNRDLVRALQSLRAEVGQLGRFSSYRCEEHEIEAAKATPGQHTYGTAWDPEPYVPRSAVVGKGFSGLGHTHADPGLVSHLDVRHAGMANITGSSPDRPAEFEDN